MYNTTAIIFSNGQQTEELARASVMLAEQSIELLTSLSIEDMTMKEVQRAARVLLNQIDKTNDVLNRISHIGNQSVVEARMRMNEAIDKCYVGLTSYHNHLQQQIYIGEATAPDIISFADFIGDLSRRLILRSLNEAVAGTSPSVVIDDELQEYL